MAKEFFTEAQKLVIVSTIQEAEKNTSGEIKVHIEKRCGPSVLDRAAKVFEKLQMDLTEQRNGVLIYLALEDKQFAILGDTGINAKVPPHFWDDIKSGMESHFRSGHFTEGLCEGVRKAGEQLKAHFPFKKDDINELPDDISFGSN